VSSAPSRSTAFKKKLYRYRPNPESTVEAQTTKKRTKPIPCDPRSIETGVRQFLADKVTGNLAGLWLLVPELLRLGAWDLVCGWTMKRPECVEPRLALQLINEAALCITGLRLRRTLNQQIFELVNGLPFLASDIGVHELLGARTVADSQRLQVALGKVRRASGDFQGRVLAIDPHRVRSFSKRHMRRHRLDQAVRPTKTAQTFFVLDADTHQPVCFTTGTSARTASNAAEELLRLAADILNTQPGQTLVLADAEHFTVELLDRVKSQTNFDLLVPMPDQPSRRKKLQELPPETFQPRWAGYATAKLGYTPRNSQKGPFYQFVQRQGERPEEHHFKAFLSTTDRDEVETLTEDFPKRWHVEEFFNAHQAIGWDRAGTCNLNIRYGQMTMALIAQTAIDRLRKRLGPPAASWDAEHLAKSYFAGLEGDVRVTGNTITVTYYNAPDADKLREHYENLPAKLKADKIDPRVPWLYGFELDFRFR
jgi:Transposase DDE domain